MRLLSFSSLFLLFTLNSCNWILQPDMIGWIEFDPQLDTTAFQLCNEEKARRGHIRYPTYKEGKRDLKAYFMEKANNLVEKQGEDGHIVIRFLVNCKGETGRFRTEQLNLNYKVKAFSPHIAQQLLGHLEGISEWWLPEKMDGYGFVTFKIKDGQLVDVI